jgi:hypothetical protein
MKARIQYSVKKIERLVFAGTVSVQPIKDIEAFDDDGISDELLLAAVQQYENQQIFETDHIDNENRG